MNKKSNYTVALEVLQNKYGVNEERKKKLTELGYDYKSIQSIVNALVSDGYTTEDQTTDLKPLVIDFDLNKYNAIEVNIII